MVFLLVSSVFEQKRAARSDGIKLLSTDRKPMKKSPIDGQRRIQE